MKTWRLIICMALGLSACARTPQFNYATEIDEFSGEKTSSATASAVGDADTQYLLELSLTCFAKDENPNAAEDTQLNLLVLKGKGDGEEIKNFSLKFDDAAPLNFSELTDFNLSEYSNELTLGYAVAIMAATEPNLRANAIIENSTQSAGVFGKFANAMAKGMVGGLSNLDTSDKEQFTSLSSEEIARGLTKKVIESKEIMVRYETLNGAVNTASFNIAEENYRKVLNDCGWHRVAKKLNVLVTGETEEVKSVKDEASILAGTRFSEPLRSTGLTKADCRLSVGSAIKIDGPCYAESSDEGLSIYENFERSPGLFALVNVFDDGAEGYWNGDKNTTHAHAKLGTMERQGGCWISKAAKICASPISDEAGTRRKSLQSQKPQSATVWKCDGAAGAFTMSFTNLTVQSNNQMTGLVAYSPNDPFGGAYEPTVSVSQSGFIIGHKEENENIEFEKEGNKVAAYFSSGDIIECDVKG